MECITPWEFESPHPHHFYVPEAMRFTDFAFMLLLPLASYLIPNNLESKDYIVITTKTQIPPRSAWAGRCTGCNLSRKKPIRPAGAPSTLYMLCQAAKNTVALAFRTYPALRTLGISGLSILERLRSVRDIPETLFVLSGFQTALTTFKCSWSRKAALRRA